MIPQFKSTEEALDYGHSIAGDMAAINDLRKKREKLILEARRLQNAGKLAHALELASGQVQFIREAMEAASQ